ncbi:hypothetical protein EOL73_03290 [Candidatus Saccharibacteria bacterium]|nr:hypothetical protein [Candidatus Saccharibacteria bacterium]NCU40754.1 hypothetical protein [Candidatus Saccharibacteria bacterium]
MNVAVWRRWRPRENERYVTRSQSYGAGHIFDVVERRMNKLTLPRRRRGNSPQERAAQLGDIVHEAQYQATHHERSYGIGETSKAVYWLWALVIQAPRAAEAQAQMNRTPHGYHNKKARLYELIDFNDAFVSSVLNFPEELLPIFTDETKRLIDKMCKRVGTRCFSNEEYEAITHGLSREIAVYRGVKQEGYEVEMTNRATDAIGIDMRITDPVSLCTLNIDTKTRSSYYYRVHDLKREGRLSEEEVLMAERNGFARVINGSSIPVVLWRIDHVVLGDIVNFEFEDNEFLIEQLRDIFSRYGICEIRPETIDYTKRIW